MANQQVLLADGQQVPHWYVARPNAVWYRVTQFFFWLYISAVGLLTLWPDLEHTTVPGLAHRAVAWLARHGVNITVNLLQVLANFAMFVPFGILGTLLIAHRLTPRARYYIQRGPKKRLRVGRAALLICLLAVAFSMAIETLQRWIPGRVSDPLDIAMNSSGAIAGAVLTAVVIWFFQFLRWSLGPGD